MKNPTGNIDRITVAVVINEKIPTNKDEENLIGGYTQNELNNLNKLIQGAIGFDENRGMRLLSYLLCLKFHLIQKIFLGLKMRRNKPYKASCNCIIIPFNFAYNC